MNNDFTRRKLQDMDKYSYNIDKGSNCNMSRLKDQMKGIGHGQLFLMLDKDNGSN